MAEPFKLLLGAGVVRDLGHHLHRADPGFDRARFEALAQEGLDGLELKARARHLADALGRTLPRDFSAGARHLVAALAPVDPDAPDPDEVPGMVARAGEGLAGWAVWPMTEWIARHGLAQPGEALDALHAMTQRFTAEWAVRPFIERHPAQVQAVFAGWCDDPSPHVRRLVSEGSRPRLPWGARLAARIADPSPMLPLLARLQDDPSSYVRRSVANHLNDISRDHPDLLADWLARHLPGAPAPRRALLRHASRSRIKAGDTAVLAAWGLGEPLDGRASLALRPRAIDLGESVTLEVTLLGLSRRPQPLAVDYVVHHVTARGAPSAKVFKGWTLELAPGETRTLVRRHPVRPVTTRTHHAGLHRVTLQVNGVAVAEDAFELRISGPPAGPRTPPGRSRP